MLIQVVMCEAAKRYFWSLEESERMRGTEKYTLIEALSRALEKTGLGYSTQAGLFEPGNLRLEWVSQPGYIACEAYSWLAFNGGLEGQYELSTILMDQDPRVRSVRQSMQRMWLEAQPAPADR